MKTVKTLPAGPTQPYWYYGADFMVRIGPKDAQTLCNPYPLPKIGHERDVSTNPDPNTGSLRRLQVKNVCDEFWLASADTHKGDWPIVFGVQV